MKRASLFLLALACMMALSGCSAPKRPFRELTGAEIRSASVQLSPPDLTVLIQDTDRLAELLQAVTLYEEAPPTPSMRGSPRPSPWSWRTAPRPQSPRSAPF